MNLEGQITKNLNHLRGLNSRYMGNHPRILKCSTHTTLFKIDNQQGPIV